MVDNVFFESRRSNMFPYGCRSVYSNVPIALLDDFRSRFPGQYRIRYRGPRNTRSDWNRGYLSRQSTCLKQNAVTFSAYPY